MSFLMEASIRASLVAAAVGAVIHGLRIGNARERHSAWCGVLFTMLLLPVFCWWGPPAAVRILPPGSDAFAVVLPPAIGEVPAQLPTSQPKPVPRSEAASAIRTTTADLLWMAYLPIAAVFVVRLIHGIALAALLRKRARAETGFFSSPCCACAVTVGWWRPVILLPHTWKEWPEPELDAVLAHEHAHVAHRDPLMKAIAAFNRCIFWFHPLSWWLENTLSALAEESSDAAAVESGHDPRVYAEYLIHQARAVGRAGSRIVEAGASMRGGVLARRIGRVLDGPPAPQSGAKRKAGLALSILAMMTFSACRLDRAERPNSGQSTMHDMAKRSAVSNRQFQEHEKATLERARSMTREEERALFVELTKHPGDSEGYRTLLRHYQLTGDVHGLDALRLWYIDHQPAYPLAPGNIDPGSDPDGYRKGKELWLRNLKNAGIPAIAYQRAADFLEGADKPLAESVLQNGRARFPDDQGWPMALGRHYAQVLLGASEPATEYNAVRKVDAQGAHSSYAEKVRAELAQSRDVPVLAQTAQWLTIWGGNFAASGNQDADGAMHLARSYIDRAIAIEPDSKVAQAAKGRVDQVVNSLRYAALVRLSPAQLAATSADDRMLVALFRMQNTSVLQHFQNAETMARELLELASHNPSSPLYGEALFKAHIVTGKAAMHRGDRKAAVRSLLAAADSPVSEPVSRGDFEMNLPRALVDSGERRGVIDFFQRIAPKSARADVFRTWASELSRGINPDLIPTFSAPGCSHDPC